MTMSKRTILGVWLAIFATIAVVLGSLAYSSTDQYSMPTTQIEDGIIPPFRG